MPLKKFPILTGLLVLIICMVVHSLTLVFGISWDGHQLTPYTSAIVLGFYYFFLFLYRGLLTRKYRGRAIRIAAKIRIVLIVAMLVLYAIHFEDQVFHPTYRGVLTIVLHLIFDIILPEMLLDLIFELENHIDNNSSGSGGQPNVRSQPRPPRQAA
jgi:hypothetical protein